MTTAPNFDAFVQLMRDNGWRVHKRIAAPPLFVRPINDETDRGHWYDPDGRQKWGGLWGGTWSDTYTWRWFAANGETPQPMPPF